MLTQLRAFWRNLARRDRAEQALDEEVRAYVDLLAREYEQKGLPPARARRAVLVEAGGVEQIKEVTREAWTGRTLADLTRDARYGLRALRRSPIFAAVAIATLAVGIGGATAVFTLIKGSLLRPLPGVADPDRLVLVERLQGDRMIDEFSYADYRDLRDRSTTLAGLAAYNGTYMKLEDRAGTARAAVSYVSDDFFTVLGLRPAAGSLFRAERDVPAAIASTVPPFQWADGATVFRRGEEPAVSELVGHELDLGTRVSAVVVSEDFFRVMRIPLAKGRAFTARDDERAVPATILSRRLADTLWPGQDPIGHFVSWPAVEGPQRAPRLVVGVASDVHDLSLTGGAYLAMYLPFAQQPGRNLTLVARPRGAARVSLDTLAAIVAGVEPSIAPDNYTTLRDRLQEALAPQRVASAWIGGFGVIALVLAAIGLYGVTVQP